MLIIFDRNLRFMLGYSIQFKLDICDVPFKFNTKCGKCEMVQTTQIYRLYYTYIALRFYKFTV